MSSPIYYPNFHIMLKPTSSRCNLHCKYCYYTYKKYLYPDEKKYSLSLKTLKTFIMHYMRSQHGRTVTFGWQGGEPTLMGLDYFKEAIKLQKKYNPGNLEIENTFQTNGTLITEEWAKFFKDNNILVGLSIDGPAYINDKYRLTVKGESKFDDILRGLKIMLEYDVKVNILCCVSESNQDHPLEVYRYFRDELGIKFIQFIPIVEKVKIKLDKHEKQKGIKTSAKKNVSPEGRKYDVGYKEKMRIQSVDSLKYGKFLFEIFKEWVHNDVGDVFVQIFDVTLGSWMGRPGGVCALSPVCGNALVLEYNGDLYSCDHFVDPEHYLGNLRDDSLVSLVNTPFQKKFGDSKHELLTQYCKECNVRIACNGGCLKNRIVESPHGEQGHQYLCPSYKYFFNRSKKYFQYMTHLLKTGKIAPDIMEYLKSNSIEDNYELPEELKNLKIAKRII